MNDDRSFEKAVYDAFEPSISTFTLDGKAPQKVKKVVNQQYKDLPPLIRTKPLSEIKRIVRTLFEGCIFHSKQKANDYFATPDTLLQSPKQSCITTAALPPSASIKIPALDKVPGMILFELLRICYTN